MEYYEKDFEKKRVLITGGLGFIGSNLAHKLVELNAEVTIVDSLIPQYGGNIYNVHDITDKVRINISDIRDTYSINFLVQNQDYIFNLAGQVSHVSSMKDPLTDLEINCKAQLSILEACRHNNPDVKIVFAGTRGQYGRANYLPVDEKHSIQPIDVNGIHNAAGEQYHILYNNIYGIRATSLRLTNTYGPRHSMKSSDQSFLNWFIRLAIDGEKIKIFGDGEQKRDFNYIEDVVRAFLMVAGNDESNGEVFNLGGLRPISIIEVTKLLLEVTKTGSYESVPFPVDRRKIEIGDYWGDFSKIRTFFGWEPKVTLREGLERTVEFYFKNKYHYWNNKD
ncbi:MAG: NAD-dependent epimerase/dehydratase family protein [Thermodesulfobacteriota bacterium]